MRFLWEWQVDVHCDGGFMVSGNRFLYSFFWFHKRQSTCQAASNFALCYLCFPRVRSPYGHCLNQPIKTKRLSYFPSAPPCLVCSAFTPWWEGASVHLLVWWLGLMDVCVCLWPPLHAQQRVAAAFICVIMLLILCCCVFFLSQGK